MDDKLFLKIKNAAIKSIEKPGGNVKPLPKHESINDPELYVFRHGETYDNLNRIFSGWRNTQLTNLGVSQAEELAEKLKHKRIDLCIVSPLDRSIETAKIALKYHPSVVFEEDPRIIERNYGDLTGHSKSKLMQENPELAIRYRRAYDFPAPRGESIEMVENRVYPFCEELVLRMKKNNINVAISSHGNSMRAIRRFFEDLTLEQALTIENPLARTYAQYIILNDNHAKAEYGLDPAYVNKLHIPSKSIFRKVLNLD